MTHPELDPTFRQAMEAAVATLVQDGVMGQQALREAQKAASETLAAFCLELLAVLDTLEAQLAFLAAQPREAPWPRLERNLGVTRNKLVAALEARGVTPLAVSVGSAPDYRLCVAVERRPAPGDGDEHVAEVLRPGWAMGDAVLRPAEVAIAVPETLDASAS
jgi:molecular chaperone GrpE (heat shock protein)